MIGKRILVVDDEPVVADAVEMVLELDEHSIDSVTNPFQALERYAPGKYDLVLTDNCMPGMAGLELAERIKRLSPEQPILLLTAFPPIGSPPGIDLVMRKPFSGDELRCAVAKLTSQLAASA